MLHRFPEDTGRRKRWKGSAGLESGLAGYAGDGSDRTRGSASGRRRAAPMIASGGGTRRSAAAGTGKTVPISKRFI